MPTSACYKTYNLFRLDQVIDIIRECLAQLELTEITTRSLNKSRILRATREGLSVEVTLIEGMIDKEMLGLFRGKPRVKADVIVSSGNSETLASFLEKFNDCLFKRIARGGG